MYRRYLSAGCILLCLIAITAVLPLSAEYLPFAESGNHFVPRNAYGVPVNIDHKRVDTTRQVQSLQELLTTYAVDSSRIRRAIALYRQQIGQPYVPGKAVIQSYYSSDTASTTPAYLVFDQSKNRYVWMALDGPLRLATGIIPTEEKLKTASGVIEQSLYETMQRNRTNPVLATQLSEVFAWEVDFYKLNRGDRYKIIYRVESRRDVEVKIRDIKAAYFEHGGESFYAFRFYQNEQWAYFDEEGEPLKKAFLQAPLEYSHVSSRYTKRRFHPVLKEYIPHLGTDYAADKGTPIRAVGDGEIVMAGYSSRSGLNVKIQHGGTYQTGYLHMSRIATGIEPGKKIAQGQVIGYVGNTGLATGPHLCFRFWKNGRQVDPFKEKIASMPPVKEKLQQAYRAYVTDMKSLLKDIPYERPQPAYLATAD